METIAQQSSWKRKFGTDVLRSSTMRNKIPITWTGLQIALAGAAAYVVCTTDLLRGAALVLH
jgi:hypothetical protein